MANIVFPIRDFIEVLFFCYLFFTQSKQRQKLQKINQSYSQMMGEQVNTLGDKAEEEIGLPKTEEWDIASYDKEMESQFKWFLKMQMYQADAKNSLIAWFHYIQ